MATILNKRDKKVASPYVVVLGGDRASKAKQIKEELPERSVYTVVPHVKNTPTTETPEPKNEVVFPVLEHKKTPSFPSLKKIESAPISEVVIQDDEYIPVAAKNPFGMRFMRSLTKKTLLKTPFSVLLPRHRKIFAAVAVLLLVVVIPFSLGLLNEPAPMITSGVVVTQGTNTLLAQVGKSIVLPVNELPLVTIATKDDIKRLNLPDAQPGNKILIFQKAGQIVVYDGETDKVIGVVNRTAP
jgi:hypothetical protein